MITIKDIKNKRPSSFNDILEIAIEKCEVVEIIVNIENTYEIISSIYLAKALYVSDYNCLATFRNNEMVWTCKPL